MERKSICTELLALSIALHAKDENKKFTADKERIGHCNLRRELLRKNEKLKYRPSKLLSQKRLTNIYLLETKPKFPIVWTGQVASICQHWPIETKARHKHTVHNCYLSYLSLAVFS